VDGEMQDLSRKIEKDGAIEVVTFDSKLGKEVFRHSASHVLAMAVKRVFPDVKLTIGPAVDDGFYYDFDTDKPFTPEDLTKIEEEMHKVVKDDLTFERLDVTCKHAKDSQKCEPYKLEMIDELGDEQISLYKSGEFVDLCKGPHVPSTCLIKAFKLTKLARTSSYSESMESRSPQRKSSTNTSICSLRQRSGTTASSEKSWSSSACMTRGQDSPSSSLKG
jgi:threonyl-tRNA synthetase